MICCHCKLPLTTIYGSRTLSGQPRIDLVHSDDGRSLCADGKHVAELEKPKPQSPDIRGMIEYYSRRANSLKHRTKGAGR